MSKTVAVVGLGYVGLPLAVAFGQHRTTIGFDVCPEKVRLCQQGTDGSGTVPTPDFAAATHLQFTCDAHLLKQADFILVAVPTPIDEARNPDLDALIKASETIGSHLKPGATVIFESTVYPGATEEVCIPALEQTSGLRWKQDFFVGYSPERINPGDQQHTLTNTVKVVAGDCPATLEKVIALYKSIVNAGVHPVSSIKVAEAAKVIENTQRDLNIALMNELAIIFNMMELNTLEVLEAAGTKWNFLPFRPGLVGGHCIGVDPYYLTHKAERLGYHPEVILAGRRINDNMGKYVAQQTIKALIKAGHAIKGARINVLGITFKENVPDVRNSRVVDMIRELETFGVEVNVHDPLAKPEQVVAEYGITLSSWQDLPSAEALILAVAHEVFLKNSAQHILGKLQANGCLIDIKSKLDIKKFPTTHAHLWQL